MNKIPKIIHYCWFGKGEMPKALKECMKSWEILKQAGYEIKRLANLKVCYEIENNESVSKATYALLDTRKIKNIGWEPQYSVKDGLKRTYTIKKETLGSM